MRDRYAKERRLAVERGWYCRWLEGERRWEPCGLDDEGARPDLNRARDELGRAVRVKGKREQ